MENKYKNCIICLKGGLIKSYWFNDNFIEEHEEIFNELGIIFDEIYKNDCCVYGASETNKDNINLKIKLCDILDKFFDLKIEIMNGWDNKIYKSKESYRKYILTYGKEN